MEAEVKEQEKTRVEKLAGRAVELAETRFDIIAIDVQEKMSEILASMASIVVVGVLIAFIVLFLSIGAAMYISDYFQSAFVGFMYMAGFYTALTVIVLVARRSLIKLPIINGLLKKINFHEED